MMKTTLRFLAAAIPLGYLIAMSAMLDSLYPGWFCYSYSFENDSPSDWLFILPTVIFLFAAGKVSRAWLVYLVVVELLVLCPALFALVQMMENEHAHPWLGLAALNQLILMLAALLVGLLGRLVWIRHKAKQQQ